MGTQQLDVYVCVRENFTPSSEVCGIAGHRKLKWFELIMYSLMIL